MAVTLISNPVETVGGIVKNLFAGFDEVEFKFKREDDQIDGVGQGIDNQILIQTQNDWSTYLNTGDDVYLFSEGDNYTYDLNGEVVAVTATTITITGDYIENATGGYINFRRNWRLESELVNENNSDVKVLPFKLIDDGDNKGNVTIDVSIGNDINNIEFDYNVVLLDDMSLLFKFQYREVYDELEGSFVLVDDRICLVYATVQPEQEAFVNSLDEPKLWKGYPFGAVLTHTNDNSDDDKLVFKYDELDINKTTLTTNNAVGEIESNKDGFIFVNIDKDNTYEVDTEFIKLKANYTGANFFDPAFFDSNFFEA